jgi:hypothetical protein
MNLKSLCGAVALALILPAASAFAASAGKITLLTGQATAARSDGTIRNLKLNDPVFSREFVSTSSNSFVNIKFADGGAVLIKPNSRFHIEQFDYGTTEKKPAAGAQADAAPQRVTASRAFFRLLKGGFRAVSGLIGKTDRNEYRVTTPVATIGIRGTDYEVILCDDACSRDPLIMERVGVTANPRDGLVASVLHGGIGVTTKGKAKVSSLDSYRSIAKALGLSPAGLVKVASRPQFVRVASQEGNTYPVDKGQTLFFPFDDPDHPLKLPNVPPGVDNGLSKYNPGELCK